MNGHAKYIFGPVNSRRFGLSLGIDLFAEKTCTLDCVYCECGRTVNLTDRISEYTPTADVIEELDRFLKHRPVLDLITFSGSGEPTLHSGTGEIISFLKNSYGSYRVAVLTNGTMFWNSDVRKRIMKADIVVPSLDAADDEAYNRMLRPVELINSSRHVEGLISFSREYKGILVLEVFVLPGVNDTEDELRLIKEACLAVHPVAVQLNTLDRPGTESWVTGAEPGRLQEIIEFFKPLRAEPVGVPGSRTLLKKIDVDKRGLVLSILRRRPSTRQDLMTGLGLDSSEVDSILDELIQTKRVKGISQGRGVFYRSVN